MIEAFIITNVNNEKSLNNAGLTTASCVKFDIHSEIFPGVEAHEARQAAADNGLVYRDFSGSNDLDRVNSINVDGVWGCTMSHFLLWKKCVERGVATIVLEHDAEVVRALPTTEYEDVLNYDPHRSTTPVVESPDGTLWPHMWGTHAYIIKPHAAQKLIDVAYAKGIMTADGFMSDAITDRSITVGACTPAVVQLNNTYANISLTSGDAR